jgi:hypothetical protein
MPLGFRRRGAVAPVASLGCGAAGAMLWSAGGLNFVMALVVFPIVRGRVG